VPLDVSYTIRTVPSGWQSFGCSGSGRWRFLDNGEVAIEGEDKPAIAWPGSIDKWAEEIADSAARHGVPAAWIAAIMGVESGGNNVGNGLMQVLPGTATSIEGRPITRSDMVGDPALSVDLGTKYFRGHLDDKYAGKSSLPVGGDPVKAAVAYNAGGVRCGTGRTEARDESCPPTGWNVIIGCARNTRQVYPSCTPSTVVEGNYVCSSDYPRRFMQYLNVAISRGWGDWPPGYVAPLSRIELRNSPAPLGSWLLALAVGAGAYAATRYGVPALARFGMARRLW
jgi:hypothetical protein